MPKVIKNKYAFGCGSESESIKRFELPTNNTADRICCPSKKMNKF